MSYMWVEGEREELTRFAQALREALPEGWEDEPMPDFMVEAIGPGPGGLINVVTTAIGERSFKLGLVDNHLRFELGSILPREDKHTRELDPEEAGLVCAHVFRYWFGPVLGTKLYPSLKVTLNG